MNEEFNSMQERKEYRTQAIIEIIKNYPVRSQEELVHYLKEDYGIESNQSTVSRDVTSIGLVKNNETNCYQLGDDAKKEQEKQELRNVLEQGDAIFYDTEVSMISLKVTPTHAQLIAAKFEAFFANDDSFIGTLVGPTGTIALLVSKEDAERIKTELDLSFFT